MNEVACFGSRIDAKIFVPFAPDDLVSHPRACRSVRRWQDGKKVPISTTIAQQRIEYRKLILAGSNS